MTRGFDVAPSLGIDWLLDRAERLRGEAIEWRSLAADGHAVADEYARVAELAEAAAAAIEAAAGRLVPPTAVRQPRSSSSDLGPVFPASAGQQRAPLTRTGLLTPGRVTRQEPTSSSGELVANHERHDRPKGARFV